MSLDVLVPVEEAERRAGEWYADEVETVLAPPPEISVSEWADAKRVIPEYAAEPGPWRTDRVPYLREIMDCFSDSRVERVVFQKAAQVGWSEVLQNVAGYFIDEDPCPILLVQPTTGEADKFSKEKLAPTIRETPSLASKIAEPKSRDSGNTITAKSFAGGHLGIIGANAPSGLRMRSVRILLFDEVDEYPPSAGEQGDPIELGENRTATFPNRKIGMGSTPTLYGLSRIADAVEGASILLRYYVPCPDCREYQTLAWGNVRWDTTGPPDAPVHHPETVSYACDYCGSLIAERHKYKMLERGEWRAANPDLSYDPTARPSSVAFHLNQLYSPFEGASWRVIVEKFLEAKDHREKLQVWVNTRLAEVWEETGFALSEEPLLERREKYAAEPLPSEKIVLLTSGVDVHGDRLEVEVVGWGPGEENWSLDYFLIPGDPTGEQVWSDLDDVLLRDYKHPFGMRLPIAATCVDSGYQAKAVYAYTAPRAASRVWAIKGVDGFGRPIMSLPKKHNRGAVMVYPVGVDSAKSTLAHRLAITSPGEGCCHFPRRPPYDVEHFRQLTAEKLVRKRNRATGQARMQWILRPNRQNHRLDVRVYAMAALEALINAGVSLESRYESFLEERGQMEDGGKGEPPPEAPRARGGGWIHGEGGGRGSRWP